MKALANLHNWGYAEALQGVCGIFARGSQSKFGKQNYKAFQDTTNDTIQEIYDPFEDKMTPYTVGTTVQYRSFTPRAFSFVHRLASYTVFICNQHDSL